MSNTASNTKPVTNKELQQYADEGPGHNTSNLIMVFAIRGLISTLKAHHPEVLDPTSPSFNPKYAEFCSLPTTSQPLFDEAPNFTSMGTILRDYTNLEDPVVPASFAPNVKPNPDSIPLSKSELSCLILLSRFAATVLAHIFDPPIDPPIDPPQKIYMDSLPNKVVNMIQDISEMSALRRPSLRKDDDFSTMSNVWLNFCKKLSEIEARTMRPLTTPTNPDSN